MALRPRNIALEGFAHDFDPRAIALLGFTSDSVNEAILYEEAPAQTDDIAGTVTQPLINIGGGWWGRQIPRRRARPPQRAPIPPLPNRTAIIAESTAPQTDAIVAASVVASTFSEQAPAQADVAVGNTGVRVVLVERAPSQIDSIDAVVELACRLTEGSPAQNDAFIARAQVRADLIESVPAQTDAIGAAITLAAVVWDESPAQTDFCIGFLSRIDPRITKRTVERIDKRIAARAARVDARYRRTG